MSNSVRILLIVIAIVCFAVALSYPIMFQMDQSRNDANTERLAALREAGRRQAAEATDAPAASLATFAPEAPLALEATQSPEATQNLEEKQAVQATPAPETTFVPLATEAAQPTRAPEATQNPEEKQAVQATPTPETTSVPLATKAAQPTLAPEATQKPEEKQAIQATPVPETTFVPLATEAAQPTRAPEATQNPEEKQAVQATPAPETTSVPLATEAVDSGRTPEPSDMPSPTAQLTPIPSPSPSPTPDRRIRSGALAYPEKEHVVFDEANILPEFREMYELNHDLIGWLSIPGTVVDYPVVRSENQEFYLTHDFFGEKNKNGQIILEEQCDPFTPSYNLVISGHNLYNDSMFSNLIEFRKMGYWKKHKTLTFDVLTERRSYVIFASFFSGDYAEDEEGFRYNADIQYRVDAEKWLAEIRKNQVFDTGIDVAFGDEFLTLTTCNHYYRKNGRFVVVCRRIREGEVF